MQEYTAKYDGVLFSPSLTRNTVFSQHNLVTDRSFSEFTVIFCRNVLIYFDRDLQNRVHSLFYDSLVMFGVLALGSKESLRFSQYEPCYEKLHPREKLYFFASRRRHTRSSSLERRGAVWPPCAS